MSEGKLKSHWLSGALAMRRMLTCFYQLSPLSPTLAGDRNDDTSHYADNWDRDATPMTKDEFGVYEVTVPAKDGRPAIPHDSKLKASLLSLASMAAS